MRRGRLAGMIVLCPMRKLGRQAKEELSIVCKPLELFLALFHSSVLYKPPVR
jgi:hypothetical protein